MDDLTDLLIEIVSDLIDNGFELPIYMFLLSRNGSLTAARYEGNPLAGDTRVRIFAEHLEDNRWETPINCFFVDGKGKSQVVKIDPGNPYRYPLKLPVKNGLSNGSFMPIFRLCLPSPPSAMKHRGRSP
jgi:hypothetical protein